jgi:HKD family nuclease
MNTMLIDGLYEQIINEALDEALSTTDKHSETVPIDKAEAAKILTKYVSEVIEDGLNYLVDNGENLLSQINLINKIIDIVFSETKEINFKSMFVAKRGEQLLAVSDKKNSILALDEKAKIIRPETSIAQSSLFTGAIHEPQMYTELKKEIVSCNRIDMLVSFIKWSGLRLIIDELAEFTQNGGELRIITTSYMGATDVRAIEELQKLPNTKIKISYDTKRTRLHAKTYVFYRDTEFTTAYVGSSNLSNAAISSGLEWNVKVTKKDLSEVIDKIEATFESYWNASEFECYCEEQKDRLIYALRAEKYYDSNTQKVYTMDIRPYSYQQEILDKLEAERKVRNCAHNLVVAATGTGKTVISALDYRRFRKQNIGKPCRLLFVAHREEILYQSLVTFRAVLKDGNFGEMFVGKYKPERIDNLFISIQTFNSQDFTEKTTSDFYDY